MSIKLLLLVACIALAQGKMVRRDAPTPDIFKDMIHHAEEFRKVFEQQINEFSKSKAAKDLEKVWVDSAVAVQKQLDAFGKSLLSAVQDANGKARELLEQSQKNIERVTKDLQKAHPDVEKNADALREKMQTAVSATLQETQKMANHLADNIQHTNDKLAPKIKAAFDDFVKDAEAVGKKLQESVNSKQ